MAGTVAARLAELGITLPEPAAPLANYVPAVRSGHTLFISGQLPLGPDGLVNPGQLGSTVSIEDGATAAKQCAINILAQAQILMGDLDRVSRVLKLTGFVNSTPEFTGQPQVINGASDFLVEVMGDRGRHTRSAVGVSALPLGAAVEIEAVLEVN